METDSPLVARPAAALRAAAQAAPDWPPFGLAGAPLIGLLRQLDLITGPVAKPSLVDGLGPWLGWAEAIPLAAALKGPGPAPVPSVGSVAAAERGLAQLRRRLVQAIEDDGSVPVPAATRRGATPGNGPTQRNGASAADPADFRPHRRRCLDLQQAMQTDIPPLRAEARAAAAGLSPALAQLAAIDAVLERVLAPHEQGLLAALPSLLQKHFDRLCPAPVAGEAQTAVPAASATTAPGTLAAAAVPIPTRAAAAPTAWLPRFQHDMRRLLLAELDLRLQPVLGLLEAAAPSPQASSKAP